MIGTVKCHTIGCGYNRNWRNISWLPKREKLDSKQTSAIDFAGAHGRKLLCVELCGDLVRCHR